MTTSVPTGPSQPERIEAQRLIAADRELIFSVLTDPQGHVAIDSSGMLQSAEGEVVTSVGDTFVVHMDREALGDLPMGLYDVTVYITGFDPGVHIAWTIVGVMRPPLRHTYGYLLETVEGGTLVTSYCDWSEIDPVYVGRGIFPVVSDTALRATLGILARTVTTR